MTDKHIYQSEIQQIKEALIPFKSAVKRAASGVLAYDYLVPGGPFQAQYDWDAFFMGVALASEISSEAIYLRNWVLNYIINSKTNGKVVGCISPLGYDVRFNHMKPFIAQGAFLAGKFLKDYFFLKKFWSKLKKIVYYRGKYLWNKNYDLGVWYDGLESGVDNNVSLQGFPQASVISVDLNTYIYREYRAMSHLAKILGKKSDEKKFSERAEKIKKNLNAFLWNDHDECYYNLDTRSDEQIKRFPFTSFLPLFANMTEADRGIKMIKRYLLSQDYFWSQFGIRSLSRNDPEYNNRNIIKPFSNWQGPVWPLFNYFAMHVLLNYGFPEKAIELARKTTKLVLEDIKNHHGMHENYDAETGQPLAADNKISWNLLAGNMLAEAIEKRNPFEIN